MLTDIESYSSEYYDEPQQDYDYDNYQGWGEDPQQTTQVYANVGWGYNNYNNYYPFWNRGFRNGYGFYGGGFYGGGFYNNFYGYGGNPFFYGGYYGGGFWGGNLWFGNRYGNYRYNRGYYGGSRYNRNYRGTRRVTGNSARRSYSTRGLSLIHI